MIVGINRNARGEHVSANARVRGQALELLLSLVRDLVPAEPDAALDNLDPHRRFELAHPEIGRRLVTALDGPLDALTHELVAVLEEHVVPRLRIDTSRPLAALHRVLGDPSPPSENRSPADPSSFTGGPTPVAIESPYLAMNYCIAVEGIYPSRP